MRTILVGVEGFVCVEDAADVVGQDAALIAQSVLVVVRRAHGGDDVLVEPGDERVGLLCGGKFSCIECSGDCN